MKIINELPPIFQAIIDRGMRPTATTIYSYAGAIYNPGCSQVPDYLVAHESMHLDQQLRLLSPQERVEENMQKASDMWWDRYLDDQYFRIEQEAEAYAHQYDFMCQKTKDRNQRFHILRNLSRILSSPIYGSVVSSSGALSLIKNYVKTK